MEINRFSLTRSTVALGVKLEAMIGVTTAVYGRDLFIIGNNAIRSELMSHAIAR